MIRAILLSLSFLPLALFGISYSTLQSCCKGGYILEGVKDEAMICCHGYGGNASIAHATQKGFPYHLVSFNFPTHGNMVTTLPPEQFTFGTPEELRPLLLQMRQCVIDGKAEHLHLYGFSAGGGAIVNALAALNSGKFSEHFAGWGISQEDREAILYALQRGTIILDCPLKSMDEIIVARGADPALLVIQEHYQKNQMVPIENLSKLKGLKLKILVHFQNPDEVISNRDDGLYITTLKTANSEGSTHLIQGKEGVHAPCLPSLIEGYKNGW